MRGSGTRRGAEYRVGQVNKGYHVIQLTIAHYNNNSEINHIIEININKIRIDINKCKSEPGGIPFYIFYICIYIFNFLLLCFLTP